MPVAISGVRRTEKSQIFTEKKYANDSMPASRRSCVIICRANRHEHEGRKSGMRMPVAISGVRRTEKSQIFTEKKYANDSMPASRRSCVIICRANRHEHEGRKSGMRMPVAISGVRRTEKSQIFTEKKYANDSMPASRRSCVIICRANRHEHEGRKSGMRMSVVISGVRRTEKSQIFTEKKEQTKGQRL